MMVNCRLEDSKEKTIIVTGGGTREPLDNIRGIANMGTGALAARIIEALFGQKNVKIKVYYLYGKRAEMPKGEYGNELICVPIGSVASLEKTVMDIMGKERVDYFIHTMAVSDYKTRLTTTIPLIEQAVDSIPIEGLSPGQLKEKIKNIIKNPPKLDNSGKISSREELIAYFDRTVKILDIIKLLQPQTFLVGFKLLNDPSEGNLFEIGFGDMIRKRRCNMVIGNYLKFIREGAHEAIAIFPEKTMEKLVGKEEIADFLVRTMFIRGETKHSQSIYEGNFQAPEEIFRQFYQTGEWLYNYGYLPEVVNQDGLGTYGNMSILSDGKLYITGRNVHKGRLSPQGGVCLITSIEKINEPSIYAHVHYRGYNKASIDTCIHEELYKFKQEHGEKISAIIHIHTDRVFAQIPLTACNYPCGTLQELATIMDVVKKNPRQDIIQLYKHGLIVMGENLKDCRDKIEKLFEEGISIELFQPTNISHQAISSEWEEHYRLMNPSDYPMKMDYNKNTYIIRKGSEDVGILFIEKDGDNLKFVMFTTNEFQQRKLGIGEKIISILELLAGNVGARNLMVITKDLCNVAGYYETKQNFKRLPDQGEFIVLKRQVQ